MVQNWSLVRKLKIPLYGDLLYINTNKSLATNFVAAVDSARECEPTKDLNSVDKICS